MKVLKEAEMPQLRKFSILSVEGLKRRHGLPANAPHVVVDGHILTRSAEPALRFVIHWEMSA